MPEMITNHDLKPGGKPLNIVFITPATALRRFPPYRWGGKVYGQSNSITGPLILGGILKRAGHHVEVYEELNAGVNYRSLLKKTDVLCLCCMTSTAPRGYELSDLFHEKSHAHVIMGGMHPTILPEEALQHADQVIVGEGEKVILDVVEGRRSEPIVTGEPVCNLDEVPFPDYSILKTPVQAANVLSTRGCPFRCTFCPTSRMFTPYRQRSVDNVIAEIRMYKKMGFRYLNFEDDNFTADKERAKEIHSYQLQPAILTPYPGTPVFEQYENSGRMITHDWEKFDMMNVTFRPAHMSPWELQELFYEADKYFYDYDSAKVIGKLFGKEYGRRRRGLATYTRLGVWGAHFCADHVKGCRQYRKRASGSGHPSSRIMPAQEKLAGWWIQTRM